MDKLGITHFQLDMNIFYYNKYPALDLLLLISYEKLIKQSLEKLGKYF